jgi:hypothetical protein
VSSPRFGSHKFSRQAFYQEQEVFPERKIVSLRDFRRGFTPSEQRQMVDPAASPRTHDFEVRTDNRLQRAPGTLARVAFGDRQPDQIFLHPTLNSLVELGMVASPEIGFRNAAGTITWQDIGLANRGEFAYTVFGGTLIFTDGINVWYRETGGSPVEPLPDAPMARTYASFAGRVFAGGTLIDGQFEPLGIRWSAADSNYKNWDGLGAGFELLLNDTSVGDRVVKLLPMSLDFMAVLMRQNIWVGRFTGQALRPVDFSVRVPGVGAVNDKTVALSHRGVIFLNDFGVYLFDGSDVPQLLSEAIHPLLLPLDYDNIDKYHAVYDPVKKRYILFTPTDFWQFELESGRWFRRKFTSMSALMYPTQIDGVRWFEAVGQWLDQGELIWLDFAGKNLGELKLWMLNDEEFNYVGIQRAIGEESYRSQTYFGECMKPYWESKLFDEQDASRLVSIKKQLIEYQGEGRICVMLPNEDNQYELVANVDFEPRNYPSLAVLNAEKTSKGTGIAICLELDCALEDLPEEPPPGPGPGPGGEYGEYGDDEYEWWGFQTFSDVHSCTPIDDFQQYAVATVACFEWCNQPVCGGAGGWLVWYSNNPTDIELGCDSPNNPIPGMLS